MSRPSDSFELDELKEEYDWLYEFDSRMAERITHDPDVHNLVDYVNKLESENAKLRELVRDALRPKYDHTLRMSPVEWRKYDADVLRRARELGVEVDG